MTLERYLELIQDGTISKDTVLFVFIYLVQSKKYEVTCRQALTLPNSLKDQFRNILADMPSADQWNDYNPFGTIFHGSEEEFLAARNEYRSLVEELALLLN